MKKKGTIAKRLAPKSKGVVIEPIDDGCSVSEALDAVRRGQYDVVGKPLPVDPNQLKLF